VDRCGIPQKCQTQLVQRGLSEYQNGLQVPSPCAFLQAAAHPETTRSIEEKDAYQVTWQSQQFARAWRQIPSDDALHGGDDGACEGARIVQALPPKMKFSGVKLGVAVRLDDDNGVFIGLSDFGEVECEQRAVDVDGRACVNALRERLGRWMHHRSLAVQRSMPSCFIVEISVNA
jgi:hypothetical protein